MRARNTVQRGISLFRAKDAVDVVETDLLLKSEQSPETEVAFLTTVAAGLGAGAQSKVLLQQSAEEGGFSILSLWFKPAYPLRRHAHNADCLYYIISGSAILGSQTLRAGDGFFVPAEATYQYRAGPDGAEILEIRHGVEHVETRIADASPDAVAAMNELVQSRRSEWEQMHVSPTMAANAVS